jgi:epoxyqueuosine reductase
MFGNLSKPMLKSAAGETPVGSAGWSREQARALALEAGFAEAGLVALPHADEERDAARFEEWVRAGRAGTMRYLERTELAQEGEAARLLRSRAGIPFPWARSVLVCLANYNSQQPRSTEPAAEGAGWIARYAWTGRMEKGKVDASGTRRPSDYHKVLLKRMKMLELRLHERFGSFEARCFVDTGPVMERALATAAGVGWTGKNTCLIHPKLGSYGFLAVLVTSLEVSTERADKAHVDFAGSMYGLNPVPFGETSNYADFARLPLAVPDRCGSCRRGLEACPTGALTAPYQMDATKCTSYLTIEHCGAIAPELMEGMGRQVFGCDICQDVCPWNRKAPVTADPELETREELVNPALEWLAAMDEAEFEGKFNGSPVRRAGFLGLKRNVAIAMGNSGLSRFAPWLEKWSEAADEGLRTAARWALEKLKNNR